METIKKKDFVELKFTGYSNGKVFDSNVEEDLKKVHPDAKISKMIICVGEGMVVPGLDKAIEEKEVGKDYEANLSAKEAFGERRRDLVKTIPLKIFRGKQIDPQPGMVFAMDESLAKIIAVSGARVITDFNSPLAGKDVVYKFKIAKKITDDKEKAEALFAFVLKFVPEFEVKEKEIVVKGPKILENYVKAFSKKFEELVGKPIGFEEKKIEEKKEGKKEEAEGEEHSHEHSHEGHTH